MVSLEIFFLNAIFDYLLKRFGILQKNFVWLGRLYVVGWSQNLHFMRTQFKLTINFFLEIKNRIPIEIILKQNKTANFHYFSSDEFNYLTTDVVLSQILFQEYSYGMKCNIINQTCRFIASFFKSWPILTENTICEV